MPNGHVMALAISAASAANQIPTISPLAAAAPAPARAAVAPHAAQPSAASAAAPQGQQHAALNQLLTKYKYGQSHGVAAAALSSLGRQILAEAKTLRLHVTLPRAPASSAATAAPPAVTRGSDNGKVDVTA